MRESQHLIFITEFIVRSDFSLPLLSVTDSTVVSDSESEDQFHTLHNVRSITNSDRDEFHTLKDVDTLTGGNDSSSEDEYHTLANVKDLSPDKQASTSHSSGINPEEETQIYQDQSPTVLMGYF